MRKTFHNVYVGDIVYILHNGGSMSEAKIIRYDKDFNGTMIGIYDGDEKIDFWIGVSDSSRHIPELHGTVYADLNDLLDAVMDQMRIVEKKVNFLMMTQAKVLTKLKEQK
jgi:hypothetical protein